MQIPENKKTDWNVVEFTANDYHEDVWVEEVQTVFSFNGTKLHSVRKDLNDRYLFILNMNFKSLYLFNANILIYIMLHYEYKL